MVADEYGKALFELATENKTLDIIEENFNLLMEGIQSNPDFLKVLTYPKISNDQKKACIKDVTKGFDLTFINFLNVIVDNQRMDNIEQIHNSFCKCLLESNNILNVTVVSPDKLSGKQETELMAQLSKFYNGKTIELSTIIDETLIGGIKVIANGEALDLSLQNKLNQLKSTI